MLPDHVQNQVQQSIGYAADAGKVCLGVLVTKLSCAEAIEGWFQFAGVILGPVLVFLTIIHVIIKIRKDLK